MPRMFSLRVAVALSLSLVVDGAVVVAEKPEPEGTRLPTSEPTSGSSSQRARVPTQEPRKHFWRTALEEAIAVAGGTAWYWIDRDRQVADWDFPSWSERLTLDVIRYDNNPFHVNFAWHAGNGAGYHIIGRVNGLSLWESMGAGLLTSLSWEYALEYREKVSLNDLIFTTGSGIPLGEFLFVLGEFVHGDEDAAEWATLRWTAGFPAALTAVLDDESDEQSGNSSVSWHSLHLAYDLSPSSVRVGEEQSNYTLHSLHLDGSFVRVPGYLSPGAFSRGFSAGEFTEASMDVSAARGGSGFKLLADTTLLGWVAQEIDPDGQGLSSAAMLGVAIAYRYRREQVWPWDDRVGVFHMPGLAAQARLRWPGGITLQAALRVHPDFAGINALANDDWNAAHPDEVGKAVLRKMGYYYGFGGSVAARAELRTRHAAVGASVWAARYRGASGRDRSQEAVTLDQSSLDDILDAEVYLRIENLPRNSSLGLHLELRNRTSNLEEFSTSASLRRVTLRFGVAL